MMAGRVGTWIVTLCVVTENLLFDAPHFVFSQQLEHMKNVAVEKNCSMSSQYAEKGYTTGNCSAAINGNSDTQLKFVETPLNCILTNCSDLYPFWSVDLGKSFSVHRITIYGRKDFERRMKCVQVWLDGQSLYSYPCEGNINVTNVIDQNLPRQGQVVNITRTLQVQDDCGPSINICEAQIWVCTAGWWGKDCQYPCSTTCQSAHEDTGQSTGEDDYCDSVNGTCLKGCTNGYWGENCNHTCGEGCDSGGCNQNNGTCQCRLGWESSMCKNCSPFYWGLNCSPCGIGCMGTCDASNGTCKCEDGWTGSHCTECAQKRYGPNCTETCGSCADLYHCDNVTGRCPSCKTGFSGPLCKECAQGWYGLNCTKTCGSCADPYHCDNVTGRCPSCKTGFSGPLYCSAGRYNVSNDCQNTCGGGCNDTCSNTNGTCQCRPGWEPPLCQDCANQYYNTSNECVTCGGGCNDTCNITDGTCQCRPGWEPPLCQHCADQYYNMSNDCKDTCGGGCHDTCSRTDGTCQCRPGWQPPLCQRCSDGHYNVSNDCQNTCGGGCTDTCTRTDGKCQCQPGWQPPLCQQKMQFREDASSRAPVGAIIGPVVAVIFVAGTVVLIVILRRRGQHKGNQPQPRMLQYEGPWDIQRQPATENPGNNAELEGVTNVNDKQSNKPIAPVKPQTYPKPVDTDDKHVYNNEKLFNAQYSSVLTSPRSGEVDNETASTAKTKESSSPNKNKHKRDAQAPPTAPKPVVKKESAPNRRIYENIELKTNLPKLYDNGENQKPHTKSEEKDQETVNSVDEEEEDIYNTEDIYASYRSMGPSSILDDLQKSLLASLASGKLGMEFAEFPRDMQHLSKVGSKPENSRKNRFKALCAYDHSRVVLRRPKGESNTDYINASYIKGCNREKAYIATQGPRSNTVDDFWWMVWQENVTQIVMLTNIKKGGKDKCEEYWPPVDNSKTYGHVTVTALKTDSRADFIVRSFVVATRKGSDQRTVYQYHYLSWPDHGVPSTVSLVNFWRYVKARAHDAIPVVHCSAGVGRTGTYIALDIASDLRSRGRDINVKDIVSRLREDRTLMVQTEAQYKFLHEAILEEYSSRETRIRFDQFDTVFPDTIDINNTSKVDKEFNMLNQMRMFVPIPKYTTAASKENMSKNRNRESLPDDEHLIYITGHVPGRNQYINAIHMSSFKKRQGLILTQLPLPDTVVDMWRLVDGWDVNTIVSLGHKDQSKSVKSYCHYWPETEQYVLKTEQHTIGLISTASLGDHLTCYNVSFVTKGSKDKTVRVLYYNDWADLVPGRISDILHLIDILESWRVEEDTPPVIVQCSDGVVRSGMFCALYDVINRAKVDQEVDVYLSVRQVQNVRPQAFTTEMQYRYCYLAAQQYKRQQSVYQNM